jgi:hypothetical protein
VHGAGRIEMGVVRFAGDDDPSARRLDDVVAKGLGDRIERQRPVDRSM